MNRLDEDFHWMEERSRVAHTKQAIDDSRWIEQHNAAAREAHMNSICMFCEHVMRDHRDGLIEQCTHDDCRCAPPEGIAIA